MGILTQQIQVLAVVPTRSQKTGDHGGKQGLVG